LGGDKKVKTEIVPFKRVLIANRGEIAVRIIHSLRQLNIAVVALASEADLTAMHVRLSDEYVHIGAAPAIESYLDIDKVIAAAKSTNCCAIHPGYGFLAENAAFAQRCQDEGIVFIGPSAQSIIDMGDKSRARDIAVTADVPVVPGRNDVSSDDLESAAKEVGRPLLLKPSAGGGGKGMVVVNDGEDVVEAAVAARRVALSSFGDDRLIVERFVHPARHVEIQVFADSYGNAVALGERECSLQRRHQKVIEECPSPVLKQDVRTKMEEASLSLVRKVGYVGAGTVEFLLGPDDQFYFLEMNTRLQVEHPVTEMVYGVDIVAAQIAVAEGGLLPDSMMNAKPRGHAIEVRIYAEDPDNGFLPTPGHVHDLRAPFMPDVRFDAALDGPGEVSVEYDPMIAKLTAWGATREAARRKIIAALSNTAILGIKTNTGLLSRLCKAPWFGTGDFHTATLDEMMGDSNELIVSEEIPVEVLAAMAYAFLAPRRGGGGDVVPSNSDADCYSPFAEAGHWRLLEGE
jgi:acetyl-CoA/propionyl-CoA carboxylase biotin carboxyl carrier protein